MAQLVEALRYKPEGSGFDSRWDPGSKRNEYQEPFLGGKSGRCVGLTTIPPSSADCLEILGALTSWSPKGLSSPVMV